jgi:formyltetrahydrofolate deformylase
VPDSFILIFSCNDKAGIQSKVSTFLYKRSAFLTDVKSFSDSETHTFFSRVVFNLSEDGFSINQIKEDFNSLAAEFDMDWEMD